MLQLIANDFHSSTANTLFSSTRDESSSLTLSSIIPLPNLPAITNLQEAQNAFANIFQYLPVQTTLQLNSTTLMFSSQQLLSTSLAHLLPALALLLQFRLMPNYEPPILIETLSLNLGPFTLKFLDKPSPPQTHSIYF